MKNWNRTGKIKAIVLGLSALPNLLMPIGAIGQQGLMMILMPLIFGSIVTPLLVRSRKDEIVKPTWNDNPLVMKRPLASFQFGAFFFLIVGISMLLGTGIKFQALNFFGLTSVSFGIGILIGIWLTLKRAKSK
ncbi:MAG: hypothetical protein FWC10_07815 [Lentimicrobiaceae bacterium]|nr:hypothetical protein [Lentimicrobiaceae bacterium]